MGIFVVSAIDSSVIPLPIPGSTDLLLLLLVAHRANPWGMAFAAIAGAILGGYLTWSTGAKGGRDAIKRHVPKRYADRLAGWVERNGVLAVVLACLLPPPFPLMPFLLAAGALGVTRKRFLVSFSIARAARYLFIAWLGVTYGRSMIRAWNHYLAGWSTPSSGRLWGFWLPELSLDFGNSAGCAVLNLLPLPPRLRRNTPGKGAVRLEHLANLTRPQH